MYVALDIEDIIDILEKTKWYYQNFNFDATQKVENNTLYMYCDWTLGKEEVIYIPFVVDCPIEYYRARIHIVVDPEEYVSKSRFEEWEKWTRTSTE